MKLVSIAMATYNGEKYLSKQLDSILCQTYPSLEIIICDDCSSDNTRQILSEYASKDSRIKLFFNRENLGFAKNFEQAISLCNGEFIALSDQDDIWVETKIDLLVNHIGDNLLIHSDAYLIDDNDDLIASSYTQYANKFTGTDFQYYLLQNNATGCTILFKKELLQYALPIPIDLHDWWLAIVASSHQNLAYYPHPLIGYRQHSSNQIGASSADKSIKIYPVELRSKAYRKHLTTLSTIQPHLSLQDEQAIFLSSLIQYFKDYFDKKICIRSFLFRIRNFQYFQVNKPWYIKYLALLSSLLGESIQSGFKWK